MSVSRSILEITIALLILLNGVWSSEAEIINRFFPDAPIMAQVAECESGLSHFNKNGKVKRGEVNSKDVGVFQINEKYHLKESKRYGLDIYTVVGNVQYARTLYDKEGLRPWRASSKCWGGNLAAKLAADG